MSAEVLSRADLDRKVRRWVDRHVAREVRRTERDGRAAIRAAVKEVLAGDLPKRQAAEVVRSVIGLNAIQARAVARYANGLVSGGTPPEEIAGKAVDYANELLDYRAELVAANELKRAESEAQKLAWREMVADGTIDEDWRRLWTISDEERACPVCLDLDGQEAGLDEPFESLVGDVMAPPDPHVGCQCAIALVPPGRERARAEALRAQNASAILRLRALVGARDGGNGRHGPAASMVERVRAFARASDTHFDPDQPRDDAGRWTDAGGGGGTTAPKAISPSAERETPLRSPVSGTKALGGGVSETLVVHFADGSKGVFKPEDGELAGLLAEGQEEEEVGSEPLRAGIKVGQQTEREVAAWEVAKLVGMDDMVAPAIETEIGGRRGVVLEWQEGTVASDSEIPYGNMTIAKSKSVRLDVERAAMFDYVIGNQDRHLGNWIVTPDGDIRLIDHGLSFGEGKIDTGNRSFIQIAASRDAQDKREAAPNVLAKPYMKKIDEITGKLHDLGLPTAAVARVEGRIRRANETLSWLNIASDKR